MLTKKRRLKKEEIDQVKKEGKLFSTPFFSLLYLKKAASPSRFAFIISKKVSKKAVERNRTKRIIAGTTRQLIKNMKEGYWTIFLVKRASLNKEKSLLAPIIQKSFKKIGLIKKQSD